MPPRPVRPMPLSLGGIPDLRNVIGRDEQADTIAGLLRTSHGVVLTGDRRVGKTSLARLVEMRLAAAGVRVARTSAQRESLADFARALHEAVLAATPTGAARRELERWSVGVEFGPLTLERDRVSASLDDLVTRATAGHDDVSLVLVIDEVPELARLIDAREPGSGGALLGTLRRLRQERSGRLSMLLLGSIGFHHVSDDAPGTLNDLIQEPVGPISHDDATYLARCLMLGSGVTPVDDAAVADRIATTAEDVPYYVQQIVFALSRRRGAVVPDHVDAVVAAALTDPGDPWNLRHYLQRIEPYYGTADAEAVATVLDCFAASTAPLSADDVRQAAAVAGLEPQPSRARLVRWIEKLEQDHYLHRVDIARSRWRSALIRRAWLAGRR
ncbi:MAG: ATP-binding protein [Dermatophilaceae bacterium]